ncbi:hypothetical protein K474DRAFT_927009 [Panus rudis PR-1116 ss-1]|nr:hypothetical protein K474DRAFT_927009 [Panus rudis PR-1116 ss-1]
MVSLDDYQVVSLIAKLCMHASLVLADRLAWTRPQPPEARERSNFEAATKRKDWAANNVMWLPSVWQALNLFAATAETYLILCVLCPALSYHPIISAVSPVSHHSAGSSGVRLTAVYIVGWVLMCAGAALRLWCLRVMGRNFTFELSVRKGHELCTSGPYSFVRHPAYTALYLCIIGRTMCTFGSGSWWLEYGMYTGWGKAILVVWATITTVLGVVLIGRTGQEDQVLRNEFGSKWDEWARETPYLLFPYVY